MKRTHPTLGQANDAAVNPLDVQLRPATAADEAFLKRVHDAARDWDLGQLRHQIDEQLFDTILKQQYSAQHTVYFQQYDVAKYAVIEWCGTGVGRLYCDFRDHEIAVLDIALLPEAQGKGIAGIILRALCRTSAVEGKRVTLCVHPLNTNAQGFYQKLGFKPVGEDRGMIRLDWWDETTTTPRFELNPT